LHKVIITTRRKNDDKYQYQNISKFHNDLCLSVLTSEGNLEAHGIGPQERVGIIHVFRVHKVGNLAEGRQIETRGVDPYLAEVNALSDMHGQGIAQRHILQSEEGCIQQVSGLNLHVLQGWFKRGEKSVRSFRRPAVIVDLRCSYPTVYVCASDQAPVQVA